MADCPKCGSLLTEHGCGVCGLGREDLLATLFATMTRDLENSIDRRLEIMKDRILAAIRERGDESIGKD